MSAYLLTALINKVKTGPNSLSVKSANRVPLRIIHVTVYRDLPSGIRKQITWEQQASQHLVDVDWSSLALHGGKAVESFERRIPALFRPMFFRNLYGWLVIKRLAKSYDLVLLRHMPFDPFVFFFAPQIRNRISVHHSREWEELPLIRPDFFGYLAGMVEKITGRIAVQSAMGVLGVTTEIAHFQVDTRAPGKQAGLYANGIALEAVELANDRRSTDAVNIVFMSNTFSAWHGLDRLVDAVRAALSIPDGFIVHVIGNLTEVQKRQVSALGLRSNLFRLYGFLGVDAYRDLIASADVGLGSLAMDRQNLTEGSTLKVREMLGMGLPVFSGHIDTALPDAFPFYRYASSLDLFALECFAHSMKSYSRSDVRKAATPYIDKLATMQVAVDSLREWSGLS